MKQNQGFPAQQLEKTNMSEFSKWRLGHCVPVSTMEVLSHLFGRKGLRGMISVGQVPLALASPSCNGRPPTP